MGCETGNGTDNLLIWMGMPLCGFSSPWCRSFQATPITKLCRPNIALWSWARSGTLGKSHMGPRKVMISSRWAFWFTKSRCVNSNRQQRRHSLPLSYERNWYCPSRRGSASWIGWKTWGGHLLGSTPWGSSVDMLTGCVFCKHNSQYQVNTAISIFT